MALRLAMALINTRFFKEVVVDNFGMNCRVEFRIDTQTAGVDLSSFHPTMFSRYPLTSPMSKANNKVYKQLFWYIQEKMHIS